MCAAEGECGGVREEWEWSEVRMSVLRCVRGHRPVGADAVRDVLDPTCGMFFFTVSENQYRAIVPPAHRDHMRTLTRSHLSLDRCSPVVLRLSVQDPAHGRRA